MTRCSNRAVRRATQGLSLLELMIGLGLGMLVVAAGLAAWATQFGASHRLTLETRLAQDLRTTVDLIVRDLRRAGHWRAAQEGVWQSGTRALQANPNAGLQWDAHSVALRRDGPDESQAPAAGYRLRDGVIEAQWGDSPWQAMTDPDTARVTQFELRVERVEDELSRLCAFPCGGSGSSGNGNGGDSASCPPQQTAHRVWLRIEARSSRDAAVTRQLHSTARVRSDSLSGACGVPP